MRKFHFFLILIIMGLFFIGVKLNFLFAGEKKPVPLLMMGGGYIDTRGYSGSLLEVGYKHGDYLWYYLRPQATLFLSQFYSGYIGIGLGWEFYLTKQIVITPSFSPGIYWRGEGRKLGCPLEFLSTLEISYEIGNRARIGFQCSHVSNAHLSHRNPGFNAFTLCISIPLNVKSK